MTPQVQTLVGNTPLIQIEGVFAKLEYTNPSGSIKDRVAFYIVDRAEKEGKLQRGHTLVEATSGNMGNALALVAAAKGYRCLVVMPRGFSIEREVITHSYGAEIQFVPEHNVIKARNLAIELGKQEGFFCPCQFDNELNVEENRTLLGPEILSQLPPGTKIDAIIHGVGTGGTLIGLGQAFRAHNPQLKLFAVEPAESPTISSGRTAPHGIEGIGDGFVPALYQRHSEEVDEVILVPEEKAFSWARKLMRDYGLFVGPSSGANLAAVEQIRSRYSRIRNILTLFCDRGEKYLSTAWMEQKTP